MDLVLEEERLQPYSDDYRRLVVASATEFVAYHDSCAEEPFVVDRCQRAMLQFLVAYDGLRLFFRRSLDAVLHSAQSFRPRPKYHLCDHLVRHKVVLYGSPRLFWCYADEDFVGVIKRIALRTKNSRTVDKVLVAKYRLFASLHAEALRSL